MNIFMNTRLHARTYTGAIMHSSEQVRHCNGTRHHQFQGKSRDGFDQETSPACVPTRTPSVSGRMHLPRAVCIFLSCVCLTFSFARPLPAPSSYLYVCTLLHFGGVELSHYGLSPVPVMHVKMYNANTPHDFRMLIERMQVV